MNDEKNEQTGAEQPQSPAVVKKATSTVAKAKVKPSPAPPAAKETPPETKPQPPAQTESTGSDVFSIFGWDC